MSLWESLFAHLQQPVAQILLTRNDIADVRIKGETVRVCGRLTRDQRTQYLNAQNTFTELLNMGVVPIVNENDTLAVSVRPYKPKTTNQHCLKRTGNPANREIR